MKKKERQKDWKQVREKCKVLLKAKGLVKYLLNGVVAFFFQNNAPPSVKKYTKLIQLAKSLHVVVTEWSVYSIIHWQISTSVLYLA